MDVTYRQARPPDISLLFERVAETSWNDLPAWARDAYTRAEIAGQVQQTVETLLRGRWNVIIVAETDDGENIGHVWIGETRDSYTGATRGYIYDIYVAPAARGEGLGRKLLNEAEERSRRRGHRELGLTVSPENETARHLYESAGFTTERLMMIKPVNQV